MDFDMDTEKTSSNLDTGWIFGINIKSNRVVNIFSAASAPFTKPQSEGGGGGSAIWHSGMGFSTDSNTRMFFVTVSTMQPTVF